MPAPRGEIRKLLDELRPAWMSGVNFAKRMRWPSKNIPASFNRSVDPRISTVARMEDALELPRGTVYAKLIARMEVPDDSLEAE